MTEQIDKAAQPADIPAAATDQQTERPAAAPAAEPQRKGFDAHFDGAWDKHGAEPGKDAAQQGEPTSEGASTKTRDERGRFASPAADARPAATTGAADPAAAVPQVDPAQKPIDPPGNFTSEQKAVFARQPPDVQRFILETEKIREADYSRRSQEIAEVRRIAEPIARALRPFQGYLAELGPVVGQTPDQIIGTLLQAEYTLRRGSPAQKLQALRNIVQSYGIDLTQPATDAGAQQVPHDPRFDQVVRQNQHLHGRLTAMEQQRQAEEHARIGAEIAAFRVEQDEKGQPKRPWFDVLAPRMSALMSSGEAKTLQDAYEIAEKPIRDRFQADLTARQQQADASRQQAVDQARRAAPVKTPGTAPRGTMVVKGIDAHLARALDQAGIN